MADIPRVFAENSIPCLSKAYKSIIKSWYRRNKKSSSFSTQHDINQTQQEHGVDRNMNGIHGYKFNCDEVSSEDEQQLLMSSRLGCCLVRHRSLDNSNLETNQPSTRNTSRRRKINHTKSKSGECFDFMATPSSYSWDSSGSLKTPHNVQSKNATTRRSGKIMYSNSSGMLKPPPIKKNLECTLEELCYGCKKKIKITRDILTDTGGIAQEQEILTIKVQPGWKKGTKITFEGKGNERPGAYREDIIFFISEKRHQLFEKDGDDLELCIEIPLVKALTGDTIAVPLLGGEEMSLTVDDVITPGYQKIITGQGMPISKQPGKRGNLRITFLVEFPTHLTDNQRSEVFSILQDSC